MFFAGPDAKPRPIGGPQAPIGIMEAWRPGGETSLRE
jgi:hypothetical protein